MKIEALGHARVVYTHKLAEVDIEKEILLNQTEYTTPWIEVNNERGVVRIWSRTSTTISLNGDYKTIIEISLKEAALLFLLLAYKKSFPTILDIIRKLSSKIFDKSGNLKESWRIHVKDG